MTNIGLLVQPAKYFRLKNCKLIEKLSVGFGG